MDEADRKLYEERCQDIRIQLKQWEGSWAASHDGKKPSREDIKNNPEMAAKYKKYNKLRDTLSGKIPPPPPKRPTNDQESREHESSRTKRKPQAEPLGTTPAKKSKFAQTPSNIRIAEMAVTPSISRKLFSPAVPTSIGPTPQRDGKVLGIFDLLNQELANAPPAPTPSKATGGDSSQLLATPSKALLSDLEEENEKLGKTPMSSGRRNYLDMFMTPVKPNNKKDGKNGGGGQWQDEDEDDKLDGIAKMFQTPEFLKRHQPAPMAGARYKSPTAIRLPRKPVGRTLSSMVASLRQMEDEKLDEEMDLMREMEAEAEAGSRPPPPPPPPRPADSTSLSKMQQPGGKAEVAIPRPEEGRIEEQPEKPVPSREDAILEDMLVKDSQTLLGGFDDENAFDSEEEEQLDRGRPLRVFKKKGQKRTTRKVNMRPMRLKRPTNSMAEKDDESDDDVVPETQYDAGSRKENIDPAAAQEVEDFVGDESGSEFEDAAAAAGAVASEDEAGEEEVATKPRGRGRPPKATTAAGKKTAKSSVTKGKGKKTAAKGKKDKEEDGDGEQGEDGTGGKVKRAARKVNELAHANFRALKLRNKGGKGGPGYGSRFRRRR